jgi:sugar/nucleoside kinase (ribokinase family)
MSELLAIGGITCDMLSVITEMPSWEATTYIEDYQMQQGGMAATAIVAASRLGASTEYIGGISDDPQGEFLRNNFRKYHVKNDRIRVFENELTPFTIVLIDKATGRRTFLHKKGVQERPELFRADIDLTGVRFILFDGFYFDTALRTAKQARERGIVSVTDISPRNRNPKLLQYMELIDYPIVSEIFIKSYFQTDKVLEAGKKLYNNNNKALLITCGERGVYMITAEGCRHIPAFGIKPVDTTGAGDVFHGAFLFSLWKGYELHEAALFSSAVSALKCTKIGGQSGIPDFDETKQFLIRQLPDGAVWLR